MFVPDSTVWSFVTNSPRLVRTVGRDDTVRIVQFSHRRAELTAQDERRIAIGLADLGMSPGDIELGRPIIDQLHVLPDGHLLVGIREEVDQDAPMFDVFDPQGVFLGSLDFGFPVSRRGVPAIVGDTMFVVTAGAFDVPYVVKVVIERGGSGAGSRPTDRTALSRE